MAITSEWEWVSINRDQDTVVSGDELLARNNWVLTRSRVSDTAYTSQLGETAETLSAYNGGVTETVTPPPFEVLTFGSFSGTVNWTTLTTKWIATGELKNGEKVYKPYQSVSIPDSAYTNLCFANTYDSKEAWSILQSTDGTTSTVINVGVSDGGNAGGRNDLDGDVFDTLVGTGFTGTATASIDEDGSLYFYCSADNQSYPQKGVDWYTQTQTWIYKDSYE